MPGISFSYSLLGDLKGRSRKLFHTLDHFSDYQFEEYLSDSPFFLGISGYVGYPRYYYENANIAILVEGCIYNICKDKLDSALIELSDSLSKQKIDSNQLAEWLYNTDGDFIIFIYYKRYHHIYIINDIFGRLPFLYYSDGSIIIGSREHQFILKQLPTVKFDRMGIALMLLFKFPLGKMTIWEKVNYLEGGTAIKINLNTGALDAFRTCNLNFHTLEKKRLENNYIVEIVNLFKKASICRTISVDRNVIGLSGGLDSRTVSAALDTIDLTGVSRLSVNHKEKYDVSIAKKVADNLVNMNWNIITAPAPTGADLLTLLRMKGGLNSLEMCFNLPFYNEVRNKYGSRIRYFTGDGGDRIKPHYTYKKRLRNIHDLAEYVINHFQACSINHVSKLLNISPQDIFNEIQRYLINCPEKSFKHKYIHFQVYESAYKWVFQGEDRNRFYFWSVTPFYSTQFFLKAMSITDQKKQKYKLYRDFLLKLSPSLASIVNRDWNLPITSIRLKCKLNIIELLHSMPSSLQNCMRKKLQHYSTLPNQEYINCMKQQLKSDSVRIILGNYFSLHEVEALLQKPGSISNPAFYTLFTLLSAIEAAYKSEVTLNRFLDRNMIA